MRACLHVPSRRAGQGRAQDAAVPGDEPDRADPGDRGPRRPGRQAADAVAVDRHPAVLRREVRQVPAARRRRARRDVAGADELLDRHHANLRRAVRRAAVEGAARAVGAALPRAPAPVLSGLGRAPRRAEIRRGQRAHRRRFLPVRRLRAHQGRRARGARRPAAPRALGERDGRAPGHAASPEVLKRFAWLLLAASAGAWAGPVVIFAGAPEAGAILGWEDDYVRATRPLERMAKLRRAQPVDAAEYRRHMAAQALDWTEEERRRLAPLAERVE